MFENAKWIGGDTEPFVLTTKSILFRKEFEIMESVQSVILHICALGLGVCTVNGAPVTDEVLSTPFTRYDKRVMYQNYDITALVKAGKNAVGVHVGNGFYNNNMKTWNDAMSPWRDDPKLIAAIEVEKKEGTKGWIYSDASWKWTSGPCVYNEMRQGEKYDARLEHHGFDLPNYDDSSWGRVRIARSPGGVLEPMDMPPIRVVDRIKPVKIRGNIYDFGANISGWVRIKGKGESGQEVILTYDEVLQWDETKLREIAAFTYVDQCELKHQDIYIMKGEGVEEYAPSFCYHGFRYVKIENAPDDLEIEAEMVHTDLAAIGSFCCSNPMLNKIHEASMRATLTNYHGIPTDCPHREQNGWTGDALMSSDQCLMNWNMEKAYTKWLHDFKDAQRPSGQLPGVIPSAGWGYNWGSGPGWDSALIQIPWKVYLATGKTDLIRDMWENMCSYMGYMESMAVGDVVDYGLSDWCQPKEQEACPVAVTDTAFYYADNCLMGKMAELIGEESHEWIMNAKRIRKSWRTNFLHDAKLKSFQTFWACALYHGLLEDEEKEWALFELVELIIHANYHLTCGIFGVKFMFSALSENGRSDLVYKMITNPEYPSYAYWINQGMTTLCENWDMTGSQNHHMYSEVDHWFYRYIGGIRFEEECLIIAPCLIPEVGQFKVTHNDIVVEQVDDMLMIKTPVNATIIVNGKIEKVPAGDYEYHI